MRNRIIFGIIVFLIFGATAKRGCTRSIGWSGLTDLVIKSDIIASGIISIKDGNTVLITDQILKGKAPKELTLIADTHPSIIGYVPLVENENVLLFLKSIDASSAELTLGSFLAKWPRPDMKEYSDIINDASPESIAGLVNEILRIESKSDINERVSILRGWLDSSDSLLNLIALQYAVNGHIWSKEPPTDDQALRNKLSILNQLSSYAFRLIQSDIPMIQAESIRLLQYAGPERALPILISKITDPNNRIRESTRNVFQRLSYKFNLGEEYNYGTDDSAEELLTIQRKWQEWLDEASF